MLSYFFSPMVLDHYVCQKAFEGDIDAVKAWLVADPSRDVTDIFEDGEDIQRW